MPSCRCSDDELGLGSAATIAQHTGGPRTTPSTRSMFEPTNTSAQTFAVEKLRGSTP